MIQVNCRQDVLASCLEGDRIPVARNFLLRCFAVASLFAVLLRVPAVCHSEEVSFIRDVAPVLVQQCQACHGSKEAESDYRLHTFEDLLKPGDYGEPPIVAGQPAESLLFRLISSDDDAERMPKDSTPLSVEQIEAVRQWIAQGAPFDSRSESESLDQQLPRRDYPQPPEVYPAAVPITAMAIRPQTDHVYVGGFYELTVWNMSTGQLVSRINNVAERTYGLTFSPDGSLLAVAGGSPGTAGEARLLRAEDGTEVTVLTTSSDVVFDIAFRPDGQEVAIALADGTIRIFEVTGGQLKLSIENHGDWVTAIAWRGDGQRLASASRDKTAKFFDANSGGLLATFSAHGQQVHDVAVSADGKQVFSSGADYRVRAWNPEDGKQIAEVARCGGEAFKLLVAGGQLFSTSADRIARQHQVEDRKEVRQFSGHTDWPISLAASVEAKRLCAGCFDGRIGVWSLEDGSQVSSFIAAPGLAVSDP